MNRAGCAVHVQFIMTAKIIYTTIALDLPLWVIKAIVKILRGFLWKGRKEANGGHCLLAWPKVARPKELGGLGMFDIRRFSLSLRARWPWLQITQSEKPWAQFQLHVCKEVQSLINMAVVTTVGDGSNTLFWKDRWLNGKSIKDIAPYIYAMLSARTLNKGKVIEAFANMRWLTDFQGALTLQVLFEFMELHQVLDQIELRPGVSDVHLWRLAASGQFSTKSAYTAMFQGAMLFEPAERVWGTWAPNKCRFFIWSVEHNRCWTSDKLAPYAINKTRL
jgi:hypothetical protein